MCARHFRSLWKFLCYFNKHKYFGKQLSLPEPCHWSRCKKARFFPVLKNNTFVMCGCVFLLQRPHSLWHLPALVVSKVFKRDISPTEHTSWLAFWNNKFLMSHLDVRGETAYFDIDMSNRNCCEGPSGGEKKQFNYEATMKPLLFSFYVPLWVSKHIMLTERLRRHLRSSQEVEGDCVHSWDAKVLFFLPKE